MKTLFHGTTYENWEKIKNEGFGGEAQTWVCSNTYSETYFYCLDKQKEADCLEDLEEAEQYGIRSAFESAQIAAAVNNIYDSRLVVIKLSIDDEFVEDDWSCENMSDIASAVDNDDLNTHGKIEEVFICEDGYNPALQAFILSGLLTMQQLNVDAINAKVLEAAELISNEGIYLPVETYAEFEWETLEVAASLNRL